MERQDVPDMAEQSIVLPAVPASAARAREFVRTLLRGSGHGALEDVALLCVSELVANVTLHTSSGRCVVRVVDEHDDILIEVGDDAAELPELQPSPSDSDHGRGLRIVEALAGEWGVRQDPDDGKHIWIRLCHV
jgi:anti-sigma regulatory factor (Ser/Thr protein kinase)